MWTYNKMLQYPINIKCTDPKLAKVIISQYGGPDGELVEDQMVNLPLHLDIYLKDLACQTKHQRLFLMI